MTLARNTVFMHRAAKSRSPRLIGLHLPRNVQQVSDIAMRAQGPTFVANRPK
jgi:hypothetical protein